MIALIDYGAGNTASVSNVLKDLDVDYVITKKESDICNADKIIFPGVGEASYAVRKLHLYNLFNLLRIMKKPFLGICLGMQLMCNESDEGNVKCLGLFPTGCKLFSEPGIKIPHMGWNQIEITKNNPLFDGVKSGEYFYFAHSYYVPENDYTIAETGYGLNFTSAMNKDNFYGVQFHPEKSGLAGIQVMRNFVKKC
ncbi:MAG: imidazole glycerol phosphate synthase subunit HisH [Melioribacteraceae bacterium]|nr:imidazole glycerol phosphate synthase subunit HisH [Melioribacteraceae bacterium]